MARLTALPSIDIIRGFKGTIDFYLWRGLPCARKWPRRAPGRRTEAEIASSALFGIVSTNYRLLAPLALAAFQEAAKDQPRTARDLYISAVYGHLHEASLSDFLTLLTECRDFLSALQAILNALGSVDTDHLLVQVQASALPAGAATLAEQQTQTAALQLLDDLQAALQSVATDRLQVRGQDQLFSIESVLMQYTTLVSPAGVTDLISLGPVPANRIWLINHVYAVDETTDITRIEFRILRPPTTIRVKHHMPTAAADGLIVNAPLLLATDDLVTALFTGTVANDTLRLLLNGYVMTVET